MTEFFYGLKYNYTKIFSKKFLKFLKSRRKV